MGEDVHKVKNHLTLDINIERSRAKDDHAAVEKSVATLTTKMTADLGKLETMFERNKSDMYKLVVGTVVSSVTALMMVARYWKP